MSAKVKKKIVPGDARKAPMDLAAEESVLSALLLYSDRFVHVADKLRPDDFYPRSHQYIFDAMLGVFARGEAVDIITVSAFLRESGKIEKIGNREYQGETYLSWLLDACPVSTDLDSHSRIIRDRAISRRLISGAGDILEKTWAGTAAPEALEFAEQTIFGISSESQAGTVFPLADVTVSTMDILERRGADEVTGVSSGFAELDALTAGFQPSDLIILAARPSMGKTALAIQMSIAAAQEGKTVGIFSLEMSKEQLGNRILAQLSGVNLSRFRGGYIEKREMDAIKNAAKVGMELPILIDDSGELSPTNARARARRMKMEYGLDLVVVDYLQLMRSATKSERRETEISEISRSLKAMAKELDIPVIALSQLNRKLEERADKRPMLSDLRESGAIEQDADVVAFIYRDEVYNKAENNPARGTAEIILGKQRNGPIGTVTLNFYASSARFGEML